MNLQLVRKFADFSVFIVYELTN